MDIDKEYCKNCNSEVTSENEYCPYCGSLFAEGIACENHPSSQAEGVCIVCRIPYCNSCSKEVSGIFLCPEHEEYEIYEGMVRVYGSEDHLKISYAKECLEQEGLHPMIYLRKATTLSLGGLDYSLFRLSGDYRTHLINEIKLMVPSVEVIEAEDLLISLDILEKRS